MSLVFFFLNIGLLFILICIAHPYKLEKVLSPKWTGPFRVIEALGNGAYRLETLEGEGIPRTWNATNLKFYFG